jgi:hypothetical protein
MKLKKNPLSVLAEVSFTAQVSAARLDPKHSVLRHEKRLGAGHEHENWERE